MVFMRHCPVSTSTRLMGFFELVGHTGLHAQVGDVETLGDVSSVQVAKGFMVVVMEARGHFSEGIGKGKDSSEYGLGAGLAGICRSQHGFIHR